MHQVGHCLSLYYDARSAKRKKMLRIVKGIGRPATRLADARFNIITNSLKGCRRYLRTLKCSCIQEGEFVYRRVSVALARFENTPPSRSHDMSYNVNPINIR